MLADDVCFRCLRACGVVATASSEERTAEADLGGTAFSVAFDPLDGSSIAGAGWAVGAIFGVWPGPGLVGRRGREQAAAAYAVYGPRTTLVLARPVAGAGAPHVVDEFVLVGCGGGSPSWVRARAGVTLPPGNPATPPKWFAPANLRAAAANPPYRALVDACLAARSTLRYSGGLVPDVHHVLSKGGGAFFNPAAAGAPPKLRLLYEVAPLALVLEAAGGAADDGCGSPLDQVVAAADARTVVALGQAGAVAGAREALAWGGFGGGGQGGGGGGGAVAGAKVAAATGAHV